MSIEGSVRERVVCDYCGNKTYVSSIINNDWKSGVKGCYDDFGKYLLCKESSEVRHACSNRVCQARLLVWLSSV